MVQEAWRYKNIHFFFRIFGITGKKSADSHLSYTELSTAERDEEKNHGGWLS
jgi:hypothetical protein